MKLIGVYVILKRWTQKNVLMIVCILQIQDSKQQPMDCWDMRFTFNYTAYLYDINIVVLLYIPVHDSTTLPLSFLSLSLVFHEYLCSIKYIKLLILIYKFCLLFLILSALESNHGKVFQVYQTHG